MPKFLKVEILYHKMIVLSKFFQKLYLNFIYMINLNFYKFKIIDKKNLSITKVELINNLYSYLIKIINHRRPVQELRLR